MTYEYLDEIREKLSNLNHEELVELVMRIYLKENISINDVITMRLGREDGDEMEHEYLEKIDGWINSRTFYDWKIAHQLVWEIKELRQEIADNYLYDEPEKAWRLADYIIKHGSKFMETADDSDGEIGHELAEFGILWLKSASAMDRTDDYWLPLVMEINDLDEYGYMDGFLESAGILLSRNALIRIYNENEADQQRDRDIDSLINMRKIAMALEDPAAYESALRTNTPEPNNLQIADLIETYMSFKQYGRARMLLEETSWESIHDYKRKSLTRKLFAAMGDTNELCRFYEKEWRNAPGITELEAYLEVAEPEKHETIKKEAEQLALEDPKPQRSVPVLAYLKNYEAAEKIILENQLDFGRVYYADLLGILDLLGKDNALFAHIVIYRALLEDILESKHSKAYHHAAGYLNNLFLIDEMLPFYPESLESHSEYFEWLQDEHSRKRAFWEQARKYQIYREP